MFLDHLSKKLLVRLDLLDQLADMGFSSMVLLGHIGQLGLFDDHLMDDLDLVIECEGLPPLELALLLLSPDVLRLDRLVLNCIVHSPGQLVDSFPVGFSVINGCSFSTLLGTLEKVLSELRDSLRQYKKLVPTQMVVVDT